MAVLVLVSDLKDISLINDIRLLVQHNRDWEVNNAAKLCFAKNEGIDLVNNGGFNKRQQYLYNLSKCTYYAAAGTSLGTNQTAFISRIECVVAIPLRLIHSFFANCDFPSRGIEYEISLLLSREFNGNSKNYAFDVVGGAPASIVWTAGSANVAEVNYTCAQLKYDAYVFQPKFQAEVDALMLSGKLAKRYIKFAATQIYDDFSNKVGDMTSYQVANGIVKPIRAWILGYVPATLRSQSVPKITSLILKSLNCEINTVNRFSQGLNTPYDLFNQVEQQMQDLNSSPDKGSLLSMQDFYIANLNQFQVDANGNEQNGLYAFYCIDLAHVQNRVDDQAVNLMIDAIKATSVSAAALDYQVIVEREVCALFQYNRNTSDITVGSMID